jgi:siroheme synthase
VLLTTAHHSEENQGRELRDDSASDTTIVIYMPGRDYSLVQEQLREACIGDETPCLVVSRISSQDQKVFATDVGRLGVAPILPAPSVLIVGEVARRESSRVATSFHETANPTTPFAIAWYA